MTARTDHSASFIAKLLCSVNEDVEFNVAYDLVYGFLHDEDAEDDITEEDIETLADDILEESLMSAGSSEVTQ